jgi:RimJ/RimL family protein N-acetyltransferase
VGQAVTVTIRALDPDDWRIYRDVRLRALDTEPSVFSSNHEKESAYPESEWRAHLDGAGKRVFALFDGDKPVGLTGIFTARTDETGRSAVLAMSYIEPAYRGRGYSRLLYQARIDWARAQPQFERIIVSHRGGNEASRRANQAFGFMLTGKGSKVWPDGQEAEEWHYVLALK